MTDPQSEAAPNAVRAVIGEIDTEIDAAKLRIEQLAAARASLTELFTLPERKPAAEDKPHRYALTFLVDDPPFESFTPSYFRHAKRHVPRDPQDFR